MNVKIKNLQYAIKVFKFEFIILQNKYVSNTITPIYFLDNMQMYKVLSPCHNS